MGSLGKSDRMKDLVLLRSQPDTFLTRRIPRTSLSNLSAQSPCFWLYLTHL